MLCILQSTVVSTIPGARPCVPVPVLDRDPPGVHTVRVRYLNCLVLFASPPFPPSTPPFLPSLCSPNYSAHFRPYSLVSPNSAYFLQPGAAVASLGAFLSSNLSSPFPSRSTVSSGEHLPPPPVFVPGTDHWNLPRLFFLILGPLFAFLPLFSGDFHHSVPLPAISRVENSSPSFLAPRARQLN